MEALADPSSLGAIDERDPRSVARWMRRFGRETGDDLGDGFEEDIERAADDVSHGDFDTNPPTHDAGEQTP
jgi:hypothetical protein